MFANRYDRKLYVHDGAANFIIAYVILLIFQLIFTLVILATMTEEEAKAFYDTLLYAVLLTTINEIATLLAPASFSKVLGQNYYKDMGFTRKLSVLQIVGLIAIALALVVGSTPIAQWVAELFLSHGFKPSVVTTLKLETAGDLIVALIFMAIIPAFAEEMLYRGFIARAFKKKSFTFAIFMSAFVFAIMHGTPLQLVHQFVLGIVLCMVYFITESIYAPIIIHFINNAVALVGNFILIKHPIVLTNVTLILMVIVGYIVLAIILYLFIKLSNKRVTLHRFFTSFNEVFREGFMSDEDRREYDEKMALIEDKVQETGLEEVREVYAQTKETMDLDEKQKARKSLFLALAFGLAMLVLNTINGFIA